MPRRRERLDGNQGSGPSATAKVCHEWSVTARRDSLRRHPTFRPASANGGASGSDKGSVCTIRDSSRQALAMLWRAGPDVYPVFPEDVVAAFRQGLEKLEADHS